MSDNLIPVRSEEEAREKGRIGGKKSGEARRAKKTMREMLDYLLDKKIKTNKGDMTTMEAIMVSMIAKASKGDVRATEFIRDTIGQKPMEKMQSEVTFTQALVEFIEVDNGQGKREDSDTVQKITN